MRDGLPSYAERLRRLHRSHAFELRRTLRSLGPRSGDRCLDLGSGDGAFTRWLADAIGSAGEVVGLDVSPAFLDLADRATHDHQPIRWVRGDIREPLFPPDTFDFGLTSQCLRSFPDPVFALQRLAQWVRPAGRVVVMENDRMHEGMFPWPAEVELAMTAALIEAARADDAEPDVGVGRRLLAYGAAAGLEDPAMAVTPVVRMTPLEGDDLAFVDAYLHDRYARAEPYLSTDMRSRVASFIDPQSTDNMIRAPNGMVCFTYLWLCARAPVRAPRTVR
jgi:SAM-dependent methyltransferase